MISASESLGSHLSGRWGGWAGTVLSFPHSARVSSSAPRGREQGWFGILRDLVSAF